LIEFLCPDACRSAPFVRGISVVNRWLTLGTNSELLLLDVVAWPTLHAREGAMGLRGIGFGELNDQYKLHPHDISQGLLKTQQLYQEIKDFFSDDDNFGYLTELYFNLQDGDRDHWRQTMANLQEIQAPIKSVIIAALTHQPDL
jgi:hypothetical protein